jgi:hypothetical protein
VRSSWLLISQRRLLPRRLLFMLFESLRLGHSDGSIGFAPHGSARSPLNPLPNYFGHRPINGTGVGLFLGNAELWQHVDDGMRGDLKLSCQLVDSNFTHK